ncbi:subclass B1 metallo-beta-lactamase [Flavobacterium sediminis]|nr:subclass B1 metallo-beta-lactamase [Flavobacterium sediminis]
MKFTTKLFMILSLFTGSVFVSCKESSSKENQKEPTTENDNFETHSTDGILVYETKKLIIKKLSDHIYQHISYLNTENFGKVACNGMLVINENRGIVFDTPTDNESSNELINYVTNELKTNIIALIPTHFHEDCVGGITEFEKHDIPAYATNQTIALLKENKINFSNPITNFEDSFTLNIGNKKVYVEYFGEGHTKDNIIGYFPDDNAIFGGCLIKEVGASKGYLGDANTKEWSTTVKKIKQKYPNAEIVIPGHGQWGKTELFDYTIKLFE